MLGLQLVLDSLQLVSSKTNIRLNTICSVDMYKKIHKLHQMQ